MTQKSESNNAATRVVPVCCSCGSRLPANKGNRFKSNIKSKQSVKISLIFKIFSWFYNFSIEMDDDDLFGAFEDEPRNPDNIKKEGDIPVTGNKATHE